MTATISDAIRYPFVRFRRLFYWLWILIPVLGWLAFSGYCIRIMQFVLKGQYREAPKFGPFWHNCLLGLYSWAVGIAVSAVIAPFAFWNITGSVIGIIMYYALAVYIGLVTPIMMIQLAETEKLARAFDIVRAHKIVFNNFRKYIIVVLQQFVVGIVFLLASIPLITLVVTIPAMSYSKQYLYTRFYRDLKHKPKY
jgi:hypothetical protein